MMKPATLKKTATSPAVPAKAAPFGVDKFTDYGRDPGPGSAGGNSHGIPGLVCNCPVCKPFTVKAAGQLSAMVAQNRASTRLHEVVDQSVLSDRHARTTNSEGFSWSLHTEDNAR